MKLKLVTKIKQALLLNHKNNRVYKIKNLKDIVTLLVLIVGLVFSHSGRAGIIDNPLVETTVDTFTENAITSAVSSAIDIAAEVAGTSVDNGTDYFIGHGGSDTKYFRNLNKTLVTGCTISFYAHWSVAVSDFVARHYTSDAYFRDITCNVHLYNGNYNNDDFLKGAPVNYDLVTVETDENGRITYLPREDVRIMIGEIVYTEQNGFTVSLHNENEFIGQYVDNPLDYMTKLYVNKDTTQFNNDLFKYAEAWENIKTGATLYGAYSADGDIMTMYESATTGTGPLKIIITSFITQYLYQDARGRANQEADSHEPVLIEMSDLASITFIVLMEKSNTLPVEYYLPSILHLLLN